MVKLVMLKDHQEGEAGDVVEVPPETALDLIEAGIARAHMGQEEHQADRFPDLPPKEEI